MPFPRLWLTVAAAALSITVSVTGPAAAQSAAPALTPAPPSDPATTVVARVGDTEITMADLLRSYEQLPPQYRQVPLEAIYQPLLERAIDTQLLAEAAHSSDIKDREDIKIRMKAAADQVLAEAYLSETIAAQVTEEALRARYEETVAAESAGEEAKARHILLESEEDARSVIADLDAGADFATLAEERSTGPSAAQGGDLGWFQAEQMVPDFSAAAFALEPGTYTKDPVQTEFGWHVILLEEKRSAGAPPFEQVQQQLASDMTRDLIQKHITDLRADIEIERFGPDGSPLPATANQ